MSILYSIFLYLTYWTEFTISLPQKSNSLYILPDCNRSSRKPSQFENSLNVVVVPQKDNFCVCVLQGLLGEVYFYCNEKNNFLL